MYLLLVPGLLYYLVYHYWPMYGAIIAFKDFHIVRGIIQSPWVGLKHFEFIFGLEKFGQVFRNTLWISVLRLAFGFPVPIIMSILLNEVGKTSFKRTVQTVVFLPHFISWVIFGGMLVNLLSVDNGVVNNLLRALIGRPVRFLTDPQVFRSTLVWTMIWKSYGFATVIYLAALAGIDPQLYEAAIIDGANRFQRIFKITLPMIRGTIVVLLILRIGNLMEAGFEQIFIMYHPAVYGVADIIDTYVYRIGLTEGRFSMAAAVGLFRSVINFTLLVTANRIARSYGERGIY
jgi:putative aldouronate transport system permease protein